MVYSLTYRRPPHVDSSRSSLNGSEKTRSLGGSTIDSDGAVSFGIPDALSFDRIISGGTCPVSINYFSAPSRRSWLDGYSEARLLAFNTVLVVPKADILRPSLVLPETS